MSGAWLIGPDGPVAIDGGTGVTPDYPEAQFKRGDVVKLRRMKALASFPREAIVAAVVPPHFSPDWALADLVGERRPLMHQVGARVVTYILVNEGDPKSYLLKEKHLLPSGKPPVEIGSVRRESEIPADERERRGSEAKPNV